MSVPGPPSSNELRQAIAPHLMASSFGMIAVVEAVEHYKSSGRQTIELGASHAAFILMILLHCTLTPVASSTGDRSYLRAIGTGIRLAVTVECGLEYSIDIEYTSPRDFGGGTRYLPRQRTLQDIPIEGPGTSRQQPHVRFFCNSCSEGAI